MEGNKSNIDFPLFIITLILILVGLIMILSASGVKAYSQYGDAHFFFKRQLIFAITGLILMYITSLVDYKIYYKNSKKLLFLSFTLLILVLIPGIGKTAGGATRWISLGFFDFQPSEAVKLALIIYISSFISRKKTDIENFEKGILPVVIVISLITILIMQQPDMGTAVNIIGFSFIILIVGGMKLKHLALLSIPGLLAMTYYITSASYRLNRVKTFLDPWGDPKGTGYHIIQSLLALGSGGLTGVGPGNSRQKFLYLPEPGTDFIFAILGEEFGLIGVLFVIILFGGFAYRGILIALNSKDLFGTLLAVGLTFMIMIQFLINIGAVTSLLPVTGITLPFISYGGTSLIISLFSVGVLLNISRQSA
ncbi:MAG: putative lipid II flippase FtsW [Bacillota bacterium]